MSNPRIPADFNWDFKKNMKMSNEEHSDMMKKNPELGALVKIHNANQIGNGDQNQNANANQNNDTLEEFNYNGELGNNLELGDEDGKDNPELGDKDNGDNNDSNHDLL